MPPRHAYWTIIVDDQPTSFRAHDVEELLPTFNRLREKHPNAQLKWFERGQLFESRDAAREQGLGRGERRWEGPRPSEEDRKDEPRRDAKWRPGGEHRDPRQKYKDAKKAKWDRYKQNIRDRWEEKARPRPDDGEVTPPHGDPMRSKVQGRGADRPKWQREDRPREQRARDGWRTPEGDRQGDRNRKPWGADRDRAPSGDRERKPSGDRERKPWGDRDRKPWGDRPGGEVARRPWRKPSGGARKPWSTDRRDDRDHRERREDRREDRDQRDRPPRDDRRHASSRPPAGSRPRWGKPGDGGKKWGAKGAGGGARKPWQGKSGAGGGRKKPFGSGPPRGPRKPKKRREDEE